MPWILRVKKQFNAAHYLVNYKGGKEPLHGHTWTAEFYFRVEKVDKAGVGIDFVEIEEFLKQILPNYCCLNEVFEFSPSAENLAQYFYREVKKRYPQLIKVVVWETDSCGAEYFEENIKM